MKTLTALALLLPGLWLGCSGDPEVQVARLVLDVSPCFEPHAGEDFVCRAAMMERVVAPAAARDEARACLAIHLDRPVPVHRTLDLALRGSESEGYALVPVGDGLELSVREGEAAEARLFVFDGAPGLGVCTALRVDSECARVPGCLLAFGMARASVKGDGELALRYGQGDQACGVVCNDQCELGQACQRVCYDEQHRPAEVCDGVDNDCDGDVDEGFVLQQDGGAEVAVGERCVAHGVCGEGVVECSATDPERLTVLCSSSPGGSADGSGPEQCNGLDDDCDGEVPVEELDVDQDTFRACGETPDCDDSDSNVFPGAEEICDGKDSDCDGDLPVAELDQDGDGLRGCEGDCADDDENRRPGVAEICDGVDQDCDGETDEGSVAPDALCRSQGVCGGTEAACAGEDGWVCPYPATYEEDESLCDGLDNDCDGRVDEQVVPPPDLCSQAGVCLGTRARCGGEDGWSCPYPQDYEALETRCDGLDNDCDGNTDEDVVAPVDLCPSDGVCAGMVGTCSGLQGFVCVFPANYEERERSCDGLDNDCDGSVDEALTGPLADRAVGICAGLTKVCGGALGWQEPDYASVPGYEAEESTCDGLDNDCDGRADEDLGGPLADLQNGVCAGLQKVCSANGDWIEPDYASQAGYEAVEASCDGLDNDCDGQVDEDLPRPPGDRQLGICANTRKRCGGAAGWLEPNYPGLPGYEEPERTCDGLDNDCSGEVDDGLTAPPASRTQGVCAGLVQHCAGAAGWQDPDFTVLAGYEDPEETCDGLDNDCDGSVDQGLSAPPAARTLGVCAGAVQVCSGAGGWIEPQYAAIDHYEAAEASCDGLDNDCDGAVDQGLVAPAASLTAGVCAGAVQVCSGAGGWVEPDYGARADYEVEELSCDTLDNDCDGLEDEDLLDPCNGCGLGDPCDAVCGTGEWACLDLGDGPAAVCDPALDLLGQAELMACAPQFSRGSAATSVVDASGTVLRYANHAPRLAWDSALGGLAYVQEGAGTNLIRNSEDLRPVAGPPQNSPWSVYGGATVEYVDTVGAPTGVGGFASRVSFVPGESLGQFVALDGNPVGRHFVLSFWIHGDTLGLLRVEYQYRSSAALAEVAAAGAWRRVVLPLPPTASTEPLRVVFRPGYGPPADPGGSVYLWGVQLEEAQFASSYIPSSGGTAGSRAAERLAASLGDIGRAAGTWTGWVRPGYAPSEAGGVIRWMSFEPGVQLEYEYDAGAGAGTLRCVAGDQSAALTVPANRWEAGQWVFASCGWDARANAASPGAQVALWTSSGFESAVAAGPTGLELDPAAPALLPTADFALSDGLRWYRQRLDLAALQALVAAQRARYGL